MISEIVEWALYAGAWEMLFRPWHGRPGPVRDAAIDVIEEYVES